MDCPLTERFYMSASWERSPPAPGARSRERTAHLRPVLARASAVCPLP